MKNTRLYEFVAMPASCLLISACVGLNGSYEEEDHVNDGLNISKIEFADGCKRAKIWMDQTHDIPGFYLEDTSQVKVSVSDRSYTWVPMRKKEQPVVESLVWAGTEEIDQLDLNLLVLVDLTQSEEALKRMRANLKRLYATYGGGHMFISFMLSHGRMSYVIPATEYVLNTYVTRNPVVDGIGAAQDMTDSNIYLYRCVNKTLDAILNRDTRTHLDSAARTTFVILSKETVYDESSNYPYDPEHFTAQQNILDKLPRIPPGVSVYFLDDDGNAGEDDTGAGYDTPTIMTVLCERTGGYAVRSFDVTMFLRHVFDSYDVYVPDYEAVICYRDGTVHAGRLRNIELTFHTHEDSLLATCHKSYSVGDLLNPTVVGTSVSLSEVLVGGIVRLISFILLMFITLQLVVPLVRYVLFCRRYVTIYRGPRQTLNSVPVPDTCYMCKAPFKPGDTIVARCMHVVHKECWDENGYHCPEYGPSCPDSSHFYDRKHPYDFRNAPFFMNWVLLSMVAATLSWVLCFLAPDAVSGPIYWFVDSILDSLAASPEIATSAEDVAAISTKHYNWPLYAFFIASYATLLMSVITVHRRRVLSMLADLAVRSVAAGVLSMLVFTIQSIFVAVNRTYQSTFTDFIPWASMSLIVFYAATYRSCIRPRHTRYLCASAILGLLCMTVMSVESSCNTMTQYVYLLYLFIIFNVGVAVTLAEKFHRHGSSILHLSGSAKEMDFALYKYFRMNPAAVITIGKSVDCSLRINWDYETDIAPIHASVRMVKDVHRLFVTDNDVLLNGKRAGYNRSYPLHYGDVFQIGKTRFTYLGV